MKKGLIVLGVVAFLSGCGGKSLTDTACEVYKNDSLEKIVPAFAALVRDNPDFVPYLEAGQRYVSYKASLLEQEFLTGEGLLDSRARYIPSRTDFVIAESTLNSFCAE
jgi:hypothetical protein